MERRRLGKSCLSITPVTLGAWSFGGWFWGGQDEAKSDRTIRASIDAGVTSIDTAPVYGFGRSEEVLGRALLGLRDQVQILTKVGLRWDLEEGSHYFDTNDVDGQARSIWRNLRPESIRHEVEQSLGRLQVDHLDLVQCHWPDPSTPIPESMGTLRDLVHEGKIGAVGVSNFSPEQMREAQAALGDVPLASDQPAYSLLDRRIEGGVLPWCREHEVGVVVYSPMARGLLTGRVTMARTFPDNDGRSQDPRYHPINRRRILDALDKVEPIAAAHGITLANLSVAWVLNQPGVTAALVGARDAGQAVENAKAASVHLSEEDLGCIDDVFGDLRLDRRPGA
jgi:aryl-alcohol dehydrogenase-like predicted oxidoreductase